MVFNFSKKKDIKLNKRALADRSHLVFEFPQHKGNLIRAYLPFLENIQITESQRSNLSEYSLLGRNSSIYSYMGAKSRQFTLTFKISLLHLLDQLSKEGLNNIFKQQYSFGTDKTTAKQAFFVGKLLTGYNPSKNIKGIEHAKLHREYYQKIANIKNPKLGLFDNTLNSIFSTIGLDGAVTPNPNYDNVNKAIDLIIYWVNLIRSSVKNNSTDTTLGPPIVRVNHGTLYNNVPCVVENYSIRPIDEAGYDVQTLTPKQIEISISLSEQRTGNFGDFTSRTVNGDNNTGWESVFKENNMDPYNGRV